MIKQELNKKRIGWNQAAVGCVALLSLANEWDGWMDGLRTSWKGDVDK